MATIMAMSAELLEGAKGIDHPELRGTHLFDLTDRVAVVTGAGRGLGRAMAMALAYDKLRNMASLQDFFYRHGCAARSDTRATVRDAA